MNPSRRAALEWRLVCERSNIISEQDSIRAEETYQPRDVK